MAAFNIFVLVINVVFATQSGDNGNVGLVVLHTGLAVVFAIKVHRQMLAIK